MRKSDPTRRRNTIAACVLSLTIIVLALSSCGAVAAPLRAAANPDAVFYEANRLYAREQYAAAAEKYQELIHAGYRSGHLYYNLGNAYYKQGVKGRAVLYYEKARRLIPQDADLKANLAYVNAGNGWLRGVATLAYFFPPNQVYFNASLCFFILATLICATLLLPAKVRPEGEKRWKPWFQGVFYLVCCLFGLSLVLAGLTYYEQSQPQAVVTRTHSPVRFEPNSGGTVYYQLREGNVIKVLEKRGRWLMIQRPDGKRGWMAADALEMI